MAATFAFGGRSFDYGLHPPLRMTEVWFTRPLQWWYRLQQANGCSDVRPKRSRLTNWIFLGQIFCAMSYCVLVL